VAVARSLGRSAVTQRKVQTIERNDVAERLERKVWIYFSVVPAHDCTYIASQSVLKLGRRESMRKRVGLLAITVGLIAGLVWSLGCRDDVFVPFPENLAGDYTGYFTLLQIEGVDTVVDTTQMVDFRFTTASYNMKLILPTEEIRFFCDCAGTYKLENGVQFAEDDPNLTNKVCTPANNPNGFFGLDQSSIEDTIVIKQDLTDEGVRKIKTLKLSRDK
jgi:hypothetical protein